MHHPIYEAGLFLAKDGRSECLACVAGLRQYSIAFPQFWDCADEIELLYAANLIQRTSKDPSLPDSAYTSNDSTDWPGSMIHIAWPSKGLENRGSTLVRRFARGFSQADERRLAMVILHSRMFEMVR